MADISKITITDGTTYDIKDSIARLEPIETRTYSDIIATAEGHRYSSFFYLRVRPVSYTGRWRVMLRVHVSVPGASPNAGLFAEETTTEIWGSQSAYGGYYNVNKLTSSSYKPLAYHSVFFASSAGYTNGCSHWIGVNLNGSTSYLDVNYKRQIVVDLLQYENCEVEFIDELYTPDTIPSRSSHTNWYTSTTSSFTHFDASTQGVRMSGDQNANTTTIHALYRYYGTHVAHSTVYRYQLLFYTDENTLTPLNNVSNGYNSTNKAMLTEVEFDPFMPIYYYNSTSTVQAGGSIGAASTFYHYAGIDIRYTLNTGTTLSAHMPLYLVVTPTSNGKCKLASTTPWAQTLPSTDDGNWYIFLGRTYSSYQFTLYQDHPVYMYNGTNVVHVYPIDTGDDSPVESGADIGSIQAKSYVSGNNTYTQQATGFGATAFGGNTEAKGNFAFAEGYGCIANKLKSHAEGLNTFADEEGSHAEGYSETDTVSILATDSPTNNVVPVNSVPTSIRKNQGIKYSVESTDYYTYISAFDRANNTITLNSSSGITNGTALRVYFNRAGGMGSHAEGYNTVSASQGSHSEGYFTQSTGLGSHSEGYLTFADKIASHVEGHDSRAIGKASHAEGYRAFARGDYSHAEGAESSTLTLYLTGANGDTTYTARSGSFSANAITSFHYLHSYVFNPDGTVSMIISIDRENETVTFDNTIGAKNDTSTTLYKCLAYGQGSHAEGQCVDATGTYSHTEGIRTVAASNYSHAEGNNTFALSEPSHASGYYTVAAGQYSYSEGVATIALGSSSHAEGNGGNSGSSYVTVTGNVSGNTYTVSSIPSYLKVGCVLFTQDGSTYSTYRVLSINTADLQISLSSPLPHYNNINYRFFNACAVGSSSHSEGYATIAVGSYSHTEGTNTFANDTAAHAEGSYTKALGNGSHAEGSSSKAQGYYSHAEGSACTALGSASHAEGTQNIANANNSHAEGNQTVVFGNQGHAEGTKGMSYGENSHIEGSHGVIEFTITGASGRVFTVSQTIPATIKPGMTGYLLYNNYYTCAKITEVDRNNKQLTIDKTASSAYVGLTFTCYLGSASGSTSHVEGMSCVASMDCTHAEGYFTEAQGLYSHSQGVKAVASGKFSHVGGLYSVAAGNSSFAHGSHAIANGKDQFVIGKANIPDNNNTYAMIVGNGTYTDYTTSSSVSSTSNAYTLDWDGNGWFAGSITVSDETGSVTLTAAQLRSLLALI